jgi:hypothetical protein
VLDPDSKWLKIAPVYLSAFSLIVSVLAMGGVVGSCEMSRRAEELSQKANQISEEANEISRSALNNTVEVQNREKNYQDEYAAIPYTDSIDSFRQPISFCNTVTIHLRNHTSKSQTISPVVRSSNICVHSDIGDCPTECKYELALPSYVIEPMGDYTRQIKIHTRGDLPLGATIELFNNKRFIWRFTYKRDQNANVYNPN